MKCLLISFIWTDTSVPDKLNFLIWNLNISFFLSSIFFLWCTPNFQMTFLSIYFVTSCIFQIHLLIIFFRANGLSFLNVAQSLQRRIPIKLPTWKHLVKLCISWFSSHKRIIARMYHLKATKAKVDVWRSSSFQEGQHDVMTGHWISLKGASLVYPHSTRWRFDCANGDHSGSSKKSKSQHKRRPFKTSSLLRFLNASKTLLVRFFYASHEAAMV